MVFAINITNGHDLSNKPMVCGLSNEMYRGYTFEKQQGNAVISQ